MKRRHTPPLDVIDLTSSPAPPVVGLTAPDQFIDLTDSPPASKVAKTASARPLMDLKITARLEHKVSPDNRQSFGQPPRRYFQTQRQTATATGEGHSRSFSHNQTLDFSSDRTGHYNSFSESTQRFGSNERDHDGGEWASFPAPDVFSHPSQRFRTTLNPDPDFFRPVAEELARGLPEPKTGILSPPVEKLQVVTGTLLESVMFSLSTVSFPQYVFFQFFWTSFYCC
jgi:hypothetical protein